MYEENFKNIGMAQLGDSNAMNELLETNNGLIWNIVKRFKGRGYEIEDLYQIGCVGFVKAVKRFDTRFDVQFSTYAVPYILGEIKKFIRDDGIIKISRSTKELRNKIIKIQDEYLKKNQKEININQLSKILKVNKEEIIYAMESINCVESIDDKISDEDSRCKFEKISSCKNQESELINKMVLNQMIDELNEKERKLIILRYYRDKTQIQVGKMMGISQVQVSRIEKRILLKMKEKLEAS